ncbi:MAG: hypothetical protein CSB49_03810 [Proteobacteria bacterium]|nr:MAG: hypothetical protein CSB49_03810 [Pseudomonadota bacterium]
MGSLACGDDDPPAVKDMSIIEAGVDGSIRLDGDTKKDTFKWPDVGSRDGQVGDLWPTGDLYSGTSFGCTTNADCFGLTCCATPWGVKICSKTCN